MRSEARSPRGVEARFALLLGLVTISGAASLGVEVVLGRMLHRLLGSTSLSVACVTAGFLGGMGAGALAAERVVARLARRGVSPLLAYGAMEVAALSTALVFAVASPALGAALRIPGGEIIIVAFVMLAAAPAGASFPFIIDALPVDDRLPARVRSVYGWNAAGGGTGALLAGLVILPFAGEWGTILACAAAQSTVAVGAVLLSRGGMKSEALAEPGASNPTRQELRPPSEEACSPALVLAFLFASGFLVLYWEVLWTRILVLTAGSTVYSFSVIASAVVLGIGAGSLLLGGKLLSRHGGWLLSLLAATTTCAGCFAVPFLPDAYLFGVRALHASPLVWGSLGAGAVAFMPSFLLGSLFPWAVSRWLVRAGTCYAVSSAGAVLGAFAGGPLGARVLSLESAYHAGAAGLFALAVLGALLVPRPRRRTAAAACAASAVLAALFASGIRLVPAWDSKRLLSGVYQWSGEDLESLPLEQSLASREILRLVHGREVIVSVELERESNTVYVRGNGKAEGSVPADRTRPSLADLPTQILLGELPAEMFAAEKERSALLIGLGSGVTLGALLGGGDAGFPPEAVDVIEIEEAFLTAMRDDASRPYLEPFVPRVVLVPGNGAQPNFHFGDARRLLAAELRGKRWDAIVSQPSEPWSPGSAPLFTAELFEEATSHLKEGGVFFQWLQMYKLDWEGIRLLARTFRRAFPHVFLVRPPATGEVIFLGSFKPIAIEKLLDAPAGRLLPAARLEVPADRLAVFLFGSKGIDALAGLSPGLPVNTDSRSELEFLGARSLYSRGDTARENLARLQALGGDDPISSYLPERLRGDAAFLRLLANRNIRLGDFAEALAILRGDASAEAQALREEAEREANAPPRTRG